MNAFGTWDAQTHVGFARKRNEDRVVVEPRRGLIVLGCGARHGEWACPRCFDLPVAQADVEAVVDPLRSAEHAGVVPFGEARDTERHFRLFRPRVFTLRCVVGRWRRSRRALASSRSASRRG